MTGTWAESGGNEAIKGRGDFLAHVLVFGLSLYTICILLKCKIELWINRLFTTI